MSKRLRILLDGYIDGNFGDDLMLYLAADGLKEHNLPNLILPNILKKK